MFWPNIDLYKKWRITLTIDPFLGPCYQAGRQLAVRGADPPAHGTASALPGSVTAAPRRRVQYTPRPIARAIL